jgi:hypothetical protein
MSNQVYEATVFVLGAGVTLMFTDGRSVVTLYSLPARTLVSPSAVNSLPLRLRKIGFLP